MQANSRSEDESRGERGILDDISGPSPSEEPSVPCSPRAWWKLAVVLTLMAAVVAVVVIKNRQRPSSQTPSVPLAQAAAPSANQVLASVNGADITLGGLVETLQQLPPEVRVAYEKQKHELLEELISKRLLLQQARRVNVDQTEAYQAAISATQGQPDHAELALIQALLRTQVLEKVEVTEEDLRSSYEQHQDELPPGTPFEEVRDELLLFVEREKQREAIQSYITDLRVRAAITRNEEWIEEQKAAAADNPLDRALKTGKPVLADFGRGVCIPCKMMKPILDELAEQYRGRAEILIIEVDEYAALTRRCGIRAIPTQIFYDASGKEVYRHQGFMPREDVVAKLADMGVQ